MATNEYIGVLTYVDNDGNTNTMYPMSVANKPVTATSSDGKAYTATVPGIEVLSTGYSFIIYPSRTSASTTCTLAVNNLGAKTLRIRSTGNTATTVAPSSATWLGGGKPVRVTFEGTFWVADVVADPDADFTYGTADLTAGTSTLASGKLYFVYE